MSGAAALLLAAGGEAGSYRANFSNMKLPAGMAFSRASSGGRWKADKNWENLGNDVVRFDHHQATAAFQGMLIEASATNNVSGGAFAGGTVGTTTLPTNWAVETSRGLTTTLVAKGTENGIEYADFQVSGTPSSSGSYQFRFGFGTSAAGAIPWFGSAYIKRVAGSYANFTAVRVGMRESGGSFVTSTNAVTDSTTDPQRAGNGFTVSGSFASQWLLQLSGITSGNAVDITFRMYGPQLEANNSAASSYVRTNGSSTLRSPDLLAHTSFDQTGAHQVGCILVDFTPNILNSADTDKRVFALKDSGGNVRVKAYFDGTILKADFTPAGGSTTTLTIGTFSAGTAIKLAVAWKNNYFAACANGGTVQSSTSAAWACASSGCTVDLPAVSDNNRLRSAYYRDYQVQPAAPTSARLQAMTT